MDIKKMILPRISNVPSSGIRKIFDLADSMEDVIKLNIGEPQAPPEYALEGGMQAIREKKVYYTPNSGIKELRTEISGYLEKKYKTQINPDNQIIVTAGASEAIDIALRILVDHGDEVIIPEPNFEAYKYCTVFTGATPVSINLQESNGFKLTRQCLEKAVTGRTKVVILSYPNNPTGAVMTKDDLIDIADFLKGKDIIIISDEIYCDFTYNHQHASLADFCEIRDHVLTVSGFSKNFSMTGWRIGYVWGHRDLLSAMHKVHQYAAICACTVSQHGALQAMRHYSESIGRVVGENRVKCNIIYNGFREIGLNCVKPEGSLYIFPNIKFTGMSSNEFCEKLLMQERVAMVPGTAFGDCGEGFARACYASCSIEDIYKALEGIKRFICRNVI